MALVASGHLKTLIMGVVNITPDSFSDGGNFFDPDTALQQVERLIREGANIIDLGAESSRPGAEKVDLEEEWRRLAPVLEQLGDRFPGTIFSLDTYKPEIMRRAIKCSISIINDIKGGADDETLELLAENGCTYIAMHMHKNPKNMQLEPLDAECALIEVQRFYERTHERLRACGFAPERIWLDPGIGFGKTDKANLCLIQQALKLAEKFEIVLGVSRKSFLGRILDLPNPLDRDPASKMLEFSFLLGGIRAVRTHDVRRLSLIKDLL